MEFVNRNKICRLCLKNCEDGFIALNETVLSNLQSMLPYLDIAITEKPIVCEPCLENINSYIHFKKRSVLNQDPTSASRNGDDLRSKLEHDLDNSNSCRFCLKMVESASYVSLDNYEADMLCKYFPELTLHGTSSAMCMACLKYLRCHFDFVTNCLQSEEDIVEYSNKEGTNDKGQVDLSDVINFISRNKCRKVPDIVKVEETMNNEINLDTKFEIKMDNLDIKEEEHCNAKDETELIGHNSSQDTVLSSRHINRRKLCPYSATRRCDPQRQNLPHPKNWSEASVYECKKCAFNTKYKNYLASHMIFHKMGEEVTINKCELCNYQSRHKSNLANHVRSHSGMDITLMNCPLCQYQTKRKCNLDSHIRIHRMASEAIIYKCPQCPYDTSYNDLFVLHMTSHKNQLEMTGHRAKVYKCGSCKFQTKHQHTLLRHSISHSIIFKCAVCSFESKQQSRLFKHMSGHMASSGEAIHGCGKSYPECSSNTDSSDVHLSKVEVETPAGDL